MKKSLMLLTVLGLALAVLLTKVERLSWSIESDSKLLNTMSIVNPTSSSREDGLYVTVEKENYAGNPVTKAGMTITNSINEQNSDLANGIVAIDIVLNNPSSAQTETGLGLTITFDDFIYNNFDITDFKVTGGNEPTYDSGKHEISWIILSINSNTTMTLSYKLKLKNNIDQSAVNDKTLRTNKQITVIQIGKKLGQYPSDDELSRAQDPTAIICSPGIKIKKSITVTKEYGSLVVKKITTGEGADLGKKFTFTVTLGDRTITGHYGQMTFASGIASFTLKNNESKTANNLPAGTTYTVTEREANQNHYTTTYSNSSGSIKANDIVTAEITNRYNMPKGNLVVKKTTTGSGANTNQTFNFKVTLDNKDINGSYNDMYFTNGEATFELSNGQTKTANNLPAGTQYTVEETDANKDGYVTTYQNGTNGSSSSAVTGTIQESETITVTVNNNKENKKYIMINKHFDTTTNYNKEVTINYNSFTNTNSLSETDYKKYIANQSLTVMASNSQTNTSFNVTADTNGNIKIPTNYANTYTDYKISKNIDTGSITLSFKITKDTPKIPESLNFHIQIDNSLNEDFTLDTSNSWTKTFDLETDLTDSNAIEITEKNKDENWEFSYTKNITNGNCTIFLVNKGGKYKLTGTIEKKDTPLRELTIEKIWNILDNNIDIYYTNKNKESLEKEVKILDKENKLLETVKLDKNGHGVTTNKYSKTQELYAEYPNGEKVKINTYKETLPDSIEVKVDGKSYILSKDNNWNIRVTGEFSEDPDVEEVKVEGFTTETPKITKDGENYKITITNTQLSSRNVNYNEPEKPVENPKTGLTTYIKVGAIIIMTSLTGLYFLKRKNVL